MEGFIEQTFNGTAPRQTNTISRNGDLVSRMYLEFDLDSSNGEVNPGHTAINNIELEIGGQRIDRQHGHWMEVLSTELTEPNDIGIFRDEGGNATMDGTKFQNLAGAGGCVAGGAMSCIVPLHFWFCRNPGLALPLIALQYHEVKIIVGWNSDIFAITNEKLYVDYIYLDTDEERRLAQVSHEYLIEQVQHQNSSNTAGADITLNFNHPVKELVFQGTIDTSTTGDPLGTNGTISGSSVLLKLNGHDRFSARNIKYFTQTQIWQHHTGTLLIVSHIIQ